MNILCFSWGTPRILNILVGSLNQEFWISNLEISRWSLNTISQVIVDLKKINTIGMVKYQILKYNQ